MPETLVQRLEQIERRLAAVERTQDAVVNTLNTVGGELGIIFESGLSVEDRQTKVIEVLRKMRGELRGLKPRGRDS